MTASLQDALQQAIATGSVWSYVLIFAGGVLAGLTPCVYPILPLTVGYIGSTAAGKRWKGFVLSLILVGSMALVYATLGIVACAVGMRFGALWGNGWVVFAIAWFFILMALLLLDVFAFPVPAFLRRMQGAAGHKKGYAGAMLTGAISGLVVSPCTGPILGLVLVSVGATAKQSTGFAYLLGMLDGAAKLLLFGLGQGILILLCGTFAGLLSHLPKSGQWMVRLKKAFALLILFGASLMLIHVGQGTNFPILTSILAGTESGAQISVHEPSPPSLIPENIEADTAPEFTLNSLAGKSICLSDQRGKSAVVLVFFSTWCSGCIAEIPAVNRFVEETGIGRFGYTELRSNNPGIWSKSWRERPSSHIRSCWIRREP